MVIFLHVCKMLNDLYIQGIDNVAGTDLSPEQKKIFLKRTQENDLAKSKGFNIYNHGMLYEYRYGLGAYLFIERLPDGLTKAWRANYARGQNKPHKITIVSETKSFSSTFKSAAGFVDWISKRRTKRAG